MDLIPLETNHGEENPLEIKMSVAAIKLANIQTSVVGAEDPVKEILLNGKVQTDENVYLATFEERQREIELLVDRGDLVTLQIQGTDPFPVAPAIRRVRNPQLDGTAAAPAATIHFRQSSWSFATDTLSTSVKVTEP